MPKNPKERVEAPVIDEQVPHSGDLGLEQPVREFDKTPLGDAVDQGLVGPPPDTLGDMAIGSGDHRRSRGKIIGGLAGAAIAAGAAVFALGGGSDSAEKVETRSQPTTATTPDTTPGTTAPETPSTAPETKPETKKESTEPIIIQTDDPQELAEQTYKNYINGINGGTINGKYEEYVEVYAFDVNGPMANALRENARAVSAQRGSYGGDMGAELVSVEIVPESVDFQPYRRTQQTIWTYSLTNTTDSTESGSQYGSIITETYKVTEQLVWVQKTIDGKQAWVLSAESRELAKELVDRKVKPVKI